ncbi:hypothetical protein EON79_09180 [bacterium]|nr:MAG: hypothetical protein EON79_09180 [bacterium]
MSPIVTYAEVTPERTIDIPPEVPLGRVKIIFEVEDKPDQTSNKPVFTAAELLQSEFFGDWADRDDLPRTDEEFAAWRKRMWEGEP